MCNIAGYIGEKEAAPILIEMIRVQEGMNGGFYTGLSVHDGQHLHYRKVQGDLAVLLKETDADRLAGKMGMIHSRTPSGGNGLWSHPFVTERNGKVCMSYVANGSLGYFKNQNEAFNQIADRLIADGVDIPCKLSLTVNKYNRLSTGEAVHMSDVMCQLIWRNREQGMGTVQAMTAAFATMPSEIVGLVSEAESPDRIYYSRVNQPMFVGFASDGAYLASSLTAFPDTVKKYQLLPPLSSGIVYRDHVEITPYQAFPTEVAPFDEKTVADAKAVILSRLEAGEATVRDLFSEIREILQKDVPTQFAAIVYLAVSELLREGRIARRDSDCIVDGVRAPKAYFSLI